MHDIGVSTGAFMGLPLAAALLRIGEIAPFAEIFSWGGHSLLDAANVRAVAASGLPITVHGPFTHDEFASASSHRHHAALALHRRHLEVSASLGATVYVVHPDLQRKPGPYSSRVLHNLQQSLAELRALQEEYRVEVVVENMPLERRSHFALPGNLDLQGLGVALDVGHATLTGSLSIWLRECGHRLRHVHLHDNPGWKSGDHHHALGTGAVDAAPVLVAARAVGARIVLEHRREADVVASLEHLRARGLLSAGETLGATAP